MGAKKKQNKKAVKVGVEWELLIWGDDLSCTERLIASGVTRAANPAKDKYHLTHIVQKESESYLIDLVDKEGWELSDVVNIEFVVIWKVAGQFGAFPVKITMETRPSFVVEPAEKEGK